MEKALDTVLRSVGNPGIASAMVSRSPSPSAQAAGTSALLASSPSPPPAASYHHSHSQPGSPKLHSLPDNALNPLGLLAEASLANRRALNPNKCLLQARDDSESAEKPQMGVASDNYFKPGICLFCSFFSPHLLPGPMTILPLRRLYIERQIQPEMLSFVSTEDVVALFEMCVFDYHYFSYSHLSRFFDKIAVRLS